MIDPDGTTPESERVGSRKVVLIHAKAPLPGFAKSRLLDPARGLDEPFVARLCDAFLRDTIDHASSMNDVELVLHFTPPHAREYFRALHATAHLDPQDEAPFGDRLSRGFARCFARGTDRVVAIGMDTPHLGPDALERAFESLDRHDLVIGPATDGGYYLIGLRKRCDAMFEGIDWSTDRVAEQTRRRAEDLGLSRFDLEESFDIDHPDDVLVLRRMLESHPGRCPHVAAVLAGMADILRESASRQRPESTDSSPA